MAQPIQPLSTAAPSWFEWITVAAIILGPVLALFAQRALDYIRERRQSRVQLFLTLMSTRATPLSPDHLRALNSIDVVFTDRSDRDIKETWRKVLAHVVTDTNQPGWTDVYADLRVDLYRAIGARVGYDFTTDHLKRQVYYPRYYSEMEIDQLQIRKALTKALTEDGLKIVPGQQTPTEVNRPVEVNRSVEAKEKPSA